jgi:regulation of enolase protein 1 (concanavalin A-like superfamily)
MKNELDKLFWIHEPKAYSVQGDKIMIKTEPKTDFWQRTYYGFRNDSAPALLMKTADPYFSFVVKTEFDSKNRFDQCGVIIYQNSDNWFKASIEFENEEYQRLGSVVTNHGYSDWATTDISADIKTMFYRLSRRESDFYIENSFDGFVYKQMRIFHLFEGGGEIQLGVYACSPEISSFEAVFSELEITECKWEPHQ